LLRCCPKQGKVMNLVIENEALGTAGRDYEIEVWCGQRKLFFILFGQDTRPVHFRTVIS
jgi:hypothetical protein